MDLLAFVLSFAIILIGCEFFTNGIEWAGKRFQLNEGAVGSVLAAVGTALPETIIPIIAIFFLDQDGAGNEIGVGAILGAPFMLTTLALFVCGVAVLIFRKRRGVRVLRVDGCIVRQDLRFFILAYSLAVLAALVPAHLHLAKVALGGGLTLLYVIYVVKALRLGETCADDELDGLYCDLLARKVFDRYGREVPPIKDPIGRRLDDIIRTEEPSTPLIVFQVALALTAIVVGANMFVGEIEALAHTVGLSPLLLSLIVVPVATELPEKFNSFLWLREGKDTFAIGNITGAMVFQSCIPVTIGVIFTEWTIDWSQGVQMLQGISMLIALLSAVVLYRESSHREIGMYGLFLGGLFYIGFIALVLMNGV
jgi:cation:H+ antiporter